MMKESHINKPEIMPQSQYFCPYLPLIYKQTNMNRNGEHDSTVINQIITIDELKATYDVIISHIKQQQLCKELEISGIAAVTNIYADITNEIKSLSRQPSSLDKALLEMTSNLTTSWTFVNLIGIQPLAGPNEDVYCLHREHSTLDDFAVNHPAQTSPDFVRYSFQVIKQAIEAKSYLLDATLPLDKVQNLDTTCINNAVALKEITQPIANETETNIINTISKLADNNSVCISNPSLQDLENIIEAQSQVIRNNTNRAAANWLVCNPIEAFNWLEAGKIKDSHLSVDLLSTNKQIINDGDFIGTMGNLKVFVYNAIQSDMLLGYKGSALDSGLIFCPFIPIMYAGIVPNKDTMHQDIRIKSRFGDNITSKEDSERAANYYSKIKITRSDPVNK